LLYWSVEYIRLSQAAQIEILALIFGLYQLSLIDQPMHNHLVLLGLQQKFSDRCFSHGMNGGDCQKLALHIARKIEAFSFIPTRSSTRLTFSLNIW
jgi:hypothetical protein